MTSSASFVVVATEAKPNLFRFSSFPKKRARRDGAQYATTFGGSKTLAFFTAFPNTSMAALPPGTAKTRTPPSISSE